MSKPTIEIAPVFRTKSYEEAVLHCFFLRHNGRLGWRMPFMEEANGLFYSPLRESHYQDMMQSWGKLVPVRTCELHVAPSSAWLSYNDAIDYCNNCNHDGFTDWRMPTFVEHYTAGLSSIRTAWYQANWGNGVCDYSDKRLAVPIRIT